MKYTLEQLLALAPVVKAVAAAEETVWINEKKIPSQQALSKLSLTKEDVMMPKQDFFVLRPFCKQLLRIPGKIGA